MADSVNPLIFNGSVDRGALQPVCIEMAGFQLVPGVWVGQLHTLFHAWGMEGSPAEPSAWPIGSGDIGIPLRTAGPVTASIIFGT